MSTGDGPTQPPQQQINAIKFKCPNDVCIEQITMVQPEPEKIHTRYFSAVVMPAMRVTCKKCGTVIRVGIGDFELQLEATILGKVDVPKIIRPS